MRSRASATDIHLIQKAFSNIGIYTDTNASIEKVNKISCNFIFNKDQTIRWVFSAHASKPEFLRFYFNGSKRASFISKIYILFFKLHLKNFLISGSFNLYVNDNDKNIFIQPDNWVMFTGTVGPNRKMILWHNKNGKSIYTKIALTATSQFLIKKEKNALELLKNFSLKNIVFPEIINHSEKYLSLEELNVKQILIKNCFNNIPINTLQDWSLKNLKKQNLLETNWWNKSVQNLNDTLECNENRLPKGLFIKMNYLKDHISQNKFSFTSVAHGDFTPWNIFFDENKIGMIDCELSEPGMPALFDIIHYVYQENILIKRNSFSIIREQLDEIFSSSRWNFSLENNLLSAAEAEINYLFYTVSFYMKLYAAQPVWHAQVNWLFATWNEAIAFWLCKEKVLDVRKILLLETAIHLHNKSYAAMKLTIDSIEDFSDSSDIDLCLSKNEAEDLYIFYASHILVKKASQKENSFMRQVCLHTINDQLLFVDCIYKFKRKSIEYLLPEKILKNVLENSFGMKKPISVYDFSYIFNFYFLNNSSIPEKYFQQYQSNTKKVTTHLQALNKEIKDYASFKSFDKKIAGQQVISLNKMIQNRGWQGFLNKLFYLKDCISSLTLQDGFIITFSGVDGAGKTTIINYSKEYIEKIMRKRVIVLRHRPSVLPILSAWKYGKLNAEKKSISSLPRQGENKNIPASLFRFIYYYVDYLLGQFYVHLKYVSRGYAVLYDRYYFDMINDARRTNIQLPKYFLKWWYKFLLKPDLNIFLYASPEDILKRKQELSVEVISSLTDQYANLFSSFQKKYTNSKYISINNVDMDKTLSHLYKEIKVL